MKRQNVQQGHDKQQSDAAPSGGVGAGESTPRRMTERLNMLMTFPMSTCLANLHARQNAAPSSHDDSGRGGARLVEAVVAKMVLIVLGDFHGVDGRIYPSIATISQLACTSEKTASRAIHTLATLGLVKVTPRNRSTSNKPSDRTNWYVIDWDVVAATAATIDSGKCPTVTCHAPDPRSHASVDAKSEASDQWSAGQVTNGPVPTGPTVLCPPDPRSCEQGTHGPLNHTTEPKRDLTAHNNRAPAEPSRAQAGPSRAEKAPKAGGGCEVVAQNPEPAGAGGGVIVEIESPIATLHRLQKREKAQNLLLNIGVRKSALAELLDHAEQEDPRNEGNPLPRVMAVLEACQKNKRCRSPIGWVSQAINEHWDLDALPGQSQQRKAGAA